MIVDDHSGVLDSVSALLADDFEVAGVANSGRQALDAARQTDPDLIVLDINMPGLDGFQTLRALQEAGSRASVVFLSMIDADDHVHQAFRDGGRGYVLKSRAARDLPTALRQAHLGRRFAPSLTSMCSLTESAGHAMQVHVDVEPFLDDLARFLDLALGRGEATYIIATEDLRTGIGARLRARGWDVDGPNGHERYRAIDAAEGLNLIMRNGLPSADLLGGVVAELEAYRRRVVDHPASRLTVVGNMSATLMSNGNAQGAMAVEGLWHQMTRELPIYTICAYAGSCFDNGGSEFRPSLCAEHDIVSHASSV